MAAGRTAGRVPVHIGLFEPGTARATNEAKRDPVMSAASLQERSALAAAGFDWAAVEAQPRWVYQDSSDCPAALEPCAVHNRGHEELERFLAGAQIRRETAVLVSTVGNATDQMLPSPLSAHDAVLALPLRLGATIGGRRLPSGTRARLADGLDPVDKDLGLRLLNQPPQAWWALGLSALAFERGTPGPDVAPAAAVARLQPILEDTLGSPVAAVWVPTNADLRWYFLPDTADWTSVIGWVIRKALPAHAPDALRRARPATFTDPDLETEAETRARASMARLEQRYASEMHDLEQQLRRAREQADPVREGLLFGSGQQVVDAVARVLADAGFAVTDLDRDLQSPKSADLLVSYGGESRLVEVKSQAGNAREDLVGDLQRHLTTWPELRADHPVAGAALIVNHQHSRLPHERDTEVYRRKEFVATLPFPVLASRRLFDWWRASDWDALRRAILGAAGQASGPDAPEARTRRWPLRG